MLAALTCHFNPAGFHRTEANFCTFASRLATQKVRLYAAELAFGNTPFRLPPIGNIVRLKGGDVLWQKERLLNHLVEQLPPEVDKVVFVDGDILFGDPDWAIKTEEALNHADVIQPFDSAVYLPPQIQTFDDDPKWMHKPSSFSDRLRGGQGDKMECAIGFAWAFRRDFLKRVGGLYDRAILGGGDTILTWGIWTPGTYRFGEKMNARVGEYLERFRAAKPTPNFIKGTVCHLYHGSEKNRRYMDRYEIAVKHDYDPDHDIKRVNGVWAWASNKPALHDEVRNYFLGRKEDE